MWYRYKSKKLTNKQPIFDKELKTLLLVSVGILFGLVLYSYRVEIFLPTVTYLNVNEGFALVFATTVLVLVTAYYAWQARKLTLVTSKQREDGALPIVIAHNFIADTSDPPSAICVECGLKNIGRGAAFNISIQFFDAKTGELVMEAGHPVDHLEEKTPHQEHVHIPREIWESIKYREDKEEGFVANFKVRITYYDIFGKGHFTVQDFTLEKATNEIKRVLGTFEFEKI